MDIKHFDFKEIFIGIFLTIIFPINKDIFKDSLSILKFDKNNFKI